MKKKFCIFIGIVFILSGLRLFDNGLLNIGRAGVFTVYNKNGSEARVYNSEEMPLLDRFPNYTRLDVSGDYDDAINDIDKLFAKVQFSETFDDMIIIYAYSPFILKVERVHNKKVNIMAAVKVDGMISYGCPLLLGSY